MAQADLESIVQQVQKAQMKPVNLLDQQTTALVVLDQSLAVLYANQAAESLLEISARRLAGESFLRVTFEAPRTEQALRDALRENLTFTRREARLRTFGGNQVNVDYTVTPITDQGPPTLLIEIRALDRLQRINRDDHHISVQETTRDLVRGMAHEIKNPLGGIRGAAQLLQRELDSERLRDYTGVIIDEADRLRNLVDRMLGPNQLPKMQPTNIHQVLERVISLVNAEEDGRIRIRRDYDPSLPELDGDQEQLIQAVLNIVRNAQQALSQTPDPEIRLTTRIVRQFTIGQTRHRMVARIEVRDNGPGIPAELFDRIYYPMISGRPEGSGLGLSITQTIVNQHHGVIECDSEPGSTRFAIYLPLEQPDDTK